jgi:hypothetical protein
MPPVYQPQICIRRLPLKTAGAAGQAVRCESMSDRKHLIRRYLLATLVGVVIGLVGMVAGYDNFLKWHDSSGIADFDHQIISCNARFVSDSVLNAGRILFQIKFFLGFLLEDSSASNILLGSTLLVPFAVYTFDVVAASRRKRRQGVA